MNMKPTFSKLSTFLKRRWPLALLFAILAGGLTYGGLHISALKQLAASSLSESKSKQDEHGHETEAKTPEKGHESEGEHDHEGEATGTHAETDADGHLASGCEKTDCESVKKVKLSATEQANIGLRLAKIELQPFERTIAIPAMIVERPGRSSVHVAAPLTGVVSRIWPMQGQSVAPGEKLFDLRLTHEEVVEAQGDLLRTAEELDVLRREIARLEEVTENGAIAGKTLLERNYERQKLEAILKSQRQRLLLHGLSPEQVEGILEKRELLGQLTVHAPEIDAKTAEGSDATAFQVEELKVDKGQHVKAGEPLCMLAEHSELFIQGKAFEQDAAALEKAAADERKVSAVIETQGSQRQKVAELNILYLDNRVEQESRSFRFYVPLPNKPTRDYRTPEGRRFTTWQFKPGQRVELLVPIERWENRIVLPIGALAQDGAEYYVFQQEEGQFARRPVKIEYRDQYSAVIADDGSLTPGKSAIIAGSYQVNLAMKNKAGGAVDPHAGHNH
jgi:multidrug efflux pump subunit AcrA (membrane-fusion protein)